MLMAVSGPALGVIVSQGFGCGAMSDFRAIHVM